MIKHEFNTLVLGSTHSKEDQDAINAFVQEQILLDRKRIYDELDNYTSGYGTLQIAKFKLKQIINDSDKIEY